jgi:hypothetical protein
MPNRYVREGIIESEAVNSLSWMGEVFYRRLINRVDDFGRYTAHSALLRASLFPLQIERVREADMPRLLLECEQAGLLFVYTANGKPILVLNKWEKGRAAASQYPAPPDQIAAKLDRLDYLGSGVHMGSKMGGVGSLGTAAPNTGARAPTLGTHALDSDSDTDSDSGTDSDSDPVSDGRRMASAMAQASGSHARGHVEPGRGGEDNARPVEPLPGFPRNEPEAKAHAGFVGCTEEFALKTWNKAMSRGGRDAQDVPIRNWRHYLRSQWGWA